LGGGVSVGNGLGLALRYEGGNVHLLSAAQHNAGVGKGGYVYEWQDATPTIPVDPLDVNSYSFATIRKEYGNIYGTIDVDYRRLVYSNSTLVQFANAGSDPAIGLYWDDTDSLLYWTYADTYNGSAGLEDQSYCFGYSELNYATGGSTPHGPWRLSSNKFKSCCQGMVGIPSAFVTAASLGTKRLGIGLGGEGSLNASADCSHGPSLSAFTPPVGVTEQTAVAGTPLVGYWPYVAAGPGAGRGLATRPAGYDFIEAPSEPFDGWGPSKWSWGGDRVWGGVWIHGANKGGFVCLGRLGLGQMSYVGATIGAEKFADFLHVTSEADMAAVAAGTSQRYEIQPTSYLLNSIASIDYTAHEYAGDPSPIAISSITASSSENQAQPATCVTSAPHGLSGAGVGQDGEFISIRGTDVATQYDNLWRVYGTPANATTFQFRDGNHGGIPWSGVSATTGTLRKLPTAGPLLQGMAFDALTNKLYILFTHRNGVNPIVAVFSVNC
jgi:hypothetical protein